MKKYIRICAICGNTFETDYNLPTICTCKVCIAKEKPFIPKTKLSVALKGLVFKRENNFSYSKFK